jgi:hypothetical protein
MSSSKILVAILKTQKEVLVPIDIFFGLGDEENLKVEFDDVSRNFVFKLSENSGEKNAIMDKTEKE